MAAQFDEILERRKKGSLKIYLGYAAGVGKTYSMLLEAQRLKASGFDVAIAYLEPHERDETLSQVKDLEVIPRRYYTSNDHTYEEMDVEAVIKRSPQIALIDELAHSNAPGSKNEKRFQDILELLDRDINVISTLNVQHLESVADQVTTLTGTEILERVPDTILQRADQIVSIDVSIDELRERLRTGKIYKPAEAERALANFFSHANLSTLRRAAFKEAAGDQVRRIDEQAFLSRQGAKISHEAIMVCLSSDPTNAEVLIRRGSKMATQLSSQCFVVYVQSKFERPAVIDPGLQKKIQDNFSLAKRMGAEVVTLQGNDISDTLVNFATENNVRHAVFGKSRLSPFRERLRGSVLLDFTHDAVGVDIHILSTVEGNSS